MSAIITESIAILIILVFILFALLRSEHADYSVSVAPLLIIPFMHLAASAAYFFLLGIILPLEPRIIFTFVHVFSLALTCVLFVIFSNKIKSVRTKRVYTTVMLGYSVLLTCAYIYEIMAV